MDENDSLKLKREVIEIEGARKLYIYSVEDMQTPEVGERPPIEESEPGSP